jgi:hypothetical protein
VVDGVYALLNRDLIRFIILNSFSAGNVTNHAFFHLFLPFFLVISLGNKLKLTTSTPQFDSSERSRNRVNIEARGLEALGRVRVNQGRARVNHVMLWIMEPMKW